MGEDTRRPGLCAGLLSSVVSLVVLLCSLGCIAGLGLLIENQVNANGSTFIDMKKEELGPRDKAFAVLSTLSYVFVAVLAIMAEVRFKRFLKIAHFAGSFVGRAALQLFLGVEILKQAEQLNTLGLGEHFVHTTALGIGWAMIGCCFATIFLYGLFIGTPSSSFRGTKPARALAILLFLLFAGCIGYLASKEGWSSPGLCTCLETWNHNSTSYTGCSVTPDHDEPWCYATSTDHICVGLELGIRAVGPDDSSSSMTLSSAGSLSDEDGEKGWVLCTIPPDEDASSATGAGGPKPSAADPTPTMTTLSSTPTSTSSWTLATDAPDGVVKPVTGSPSQATTTPTPLGSLAPTPAPDATTAPNAPNITRTPATTAAPNATLAPGPPTPTSLISTPSPPEPTVTTPAPGSRTATPTPALGTLVPTVAPTPAPTIAPTTAPTIVPTAAPTMPPTTAPTMTPTTTTTMVPTIPRTTVPTTATTMAPTPAPTIPPAAAPTTTPTTATMVSTMPPTIAPTITPINATTTAPTTAPTAAPTPAPTAVPTKAPTVSPTTAPTTAPATATTMAPATSPTMTNAIVPTAAPTLRPATTAAPGAIKTLSATATVAGADGTAAPTLSAGTLAPTPLPVPQTPAPNETVTGTQAATDAAASEGGGGGGGGVAAAVVCVLLVCCCFAFAVHHQLRRKRTNNKKFRLEDVAFDVEELEDTMATEELDALRDLETTCPHCYVPVKPHDTRCSNCNRPLTEEAFATGLAAVGQYMRLVFGSLKKSIQATFS